MSILIRRIVLTVGLVCLAACAGARAAAASKAGAPAEHVLGRAQADEQVSVKRGDVIRVPLPMQAESWQVEYDPQALQSLQPASELAKPGASGWRFSVRADRGESVLAFTPMSRGPNPPRLAFTLHIEP